MDSRIFPFGAKVKKIVSHRDYLYASKLSSGDSRIFHFGAKVKKIVSHREYLYASKLSCGDSRIFYFGAKVKNKSLIVSIYINLN